MAPIHIDPTNLTWSPVAPSPQTLCVSWLITLSACWKWGQILPSTSDDVFRKLTIGVFLNGGFDAANALCLPACLLLWAQTLLMDTGSGNGKSLVCNKINDGELAIMENEILVRVCVARDGHYKHVWTMHLVSGYVNRFWDFYVSLTKMTLRGLNIYELNRV